MSRSIDERVVEMRFDNKDFEGGIKESLASLAKLESALSKNISSESLDNISRSANKVDLSGLIKSVESISDRFSTFGIVGMRVIENIVDGLMNGLGRAINSVTSQIVSGGLQRAMNIENAHFQLQGLIDDEVKVQQIMKQANDSVDGTAYSYDVAAKAASMFTASGVQAGEQMEKALKGIAGVAATTNSDYESMANIFTTVAGNGRLMGDQLLQLSNRGMNAAAALKDYFNGVNSGAINASDSVKNAIQQITGAQKTMTGSIQSTKDALEEQYEAASKQYQAQYDLRKKTLDKEYKELQKVLTNEYNLKKDAFDKEYKALSDSLDAEIKAQQKANEQRIKEANKAYEEDVSNYRKATEEKIALIDEEYAENLKLIDEEAYRRTKAIEDQIQAIDDEIEAEEKAKKETERATKLAELNKAVAAAETVEARQKAEEALAEYQKKIAEEDLAEYRKAQKKKLQEEKTAIQEETALKKQEAKEQRDAAVTAVQEESTATLNAMAEKHEAESEALQESLNTQIQQMQEAKTERLAALKESQSAELESLKEAQNAQLEAYKEAQEAQLDALKEANNKKLKELKKSISAQQKAISGFSGAAEVTEADIREMVSDGLISFDIFSEAMAETFGEHAKDANKTFTGSLANIRAALSRTGALFYSPLIQQDGEFVQFFNAIRIKINEFNAALGASNGLAQQFTDWVRKIVAKLTDIVNGFELANTYVQKFGNGTEKVVESAHAKMEELGDGTKRIVQGDFYTPFHALQDLVLSLVNVLKGLYSVITPIGQAFYDVFVADKTPEGIYKFIERIRKLSEGLKLSEENSKKLKTGFTGLFSVINSIIGVISRLVIALTRSRGETTSLSDKIFNLIEAVGKVLISFADWVDSSTLLNTIIQKVGETVPKAMGFVVEAVSGVINWFSNLIDKFKESETVSSNLDKAFSGLKSVGEAISGVFKELWERINPNIDASNLLSEAISALVEFVLDLVGGVGDLLTKFAEWIETSPKLKDVVENVGELVSKIGDAITNSDIDIWDTITNILTKISNIDLGKAVQSIKDFISTLFGFGSSNNTDDEILKLTSFTDNVDNLNRSMEQINPFLDWVKEKFLPLFTGENLGNAVSLAGGGGLVYLLIQLAKGFKTVSESLAGLFGAGTNTIQQIPGLLQSLKTSIDSYGKNIRADAFLKTVIGLSIGIAVITGALVVLSKQNPQGLIVAAIALGVVGTALVLAIEKLTIAALKTKTTENALNTAAVGLKKALGNIGKAVKIKAITSGVKDIAKAIGFIIIDIAAIMYLYNKDKDGFNHALLIVAAIGATLLGIIGLMSGIGEHFEKGMTAFAKVGVGVLALSLAVLIAVSAIKKILDLDFNWERDGEKVLLLASLFGMVGLLAIAVGAASAIAGKGKIKTGPLLAMCGLIAVSVWALKEVMELELPTDWKSRLAILAGLFGALGLLILAVGKASEMAGGKLKATGTILSMCLFIAVAVAAIAVLAVFPAEALKKGAIALGGILLTLAAVLLATAKMSDSEAWKTIVAMCGMVATIVIALAFLSFIQWPTLLKSAAALGGVLLVLALVFRGVGKIANEGVWKPVLAMIGVIAAVIVGLKILSSVESWENLLAAAISMSAVLLAVGKSLSMLNQSESPSMDHIIEFIVGILGVAAIAQILRMMSDMSWDTLLASAGAIAGVLLAIGGTFKIINSTEEIGEDKMLAFLVGCLGAAVIGFILNQSAAIPWETLLATAGSIAGVMLAIGETFKIINSTEDVGTDKIISFVVGCLGAAFIGWVLSRVAGAPWDSLLGMGGAIAAVLLSMAAAFRIMGAATIDISTIAAFVAGCWAVGMVGEAIGQAADHPWEQLLAAGIAMSVVILSMALAMGLVALVGSIAPEAMAGILALDAFIADLTVVLLALGALTEIPGFTELISAGGGILVQIGEALGDFVGSIIEGIGEGVGRALEAIGTSLSNFMTNAQPFFDGLKDIDQSTLDAAGTLAKVIIAISAAELLTGIMNLYSKFIGAGDMATFGNRLATFGEAIKQFDEVTKDIKGYNLKNVAEGAMYLVELAKEIPNTGGLVAKVTGDNDIGTFGQSLSTFGRWLKTFDTYTSGIKNPLSWETLTTGVGYLLNMAKNVPNTGGLVAKVTGDNDIGTFGQSLSTFGRWLKTFDTYTSGITNPAKWHDLAVGAAYWIGFAKSIPNSGGLVSLVTGDNDIGTFGQSLSTFGKYLNTFNENTKDINATRLTMLGTSLNILIETCKNIESVNNGKLSDFGSALEKMAKSGLEAFIKAMQSQTPTAISTVKNSISQIRAVPFGDSSVPSAFTQLATKSMTNYKNAVTTQTPVVKTAITTLLTSITTLIKNKDSEFNKLGKNNIDKYLEAIKSLYSKAQQIGKEFSQKAIDGIESLSRSYKSAGEKMAEAFIDGLENKASRDARSAARNMSDSILDALDRVYNDFKDTGRNAGQGFIDGLDDKIGRAARKARDLAREARWAIEDELEIYSPSRVMREDGGYTGEGFALGIQDWFTRVKRAASNLGNSAMDGLEDAITVLNDDSDLEPVIKPIVDLTDVMSAADMINSMFSDAVANIGSSVSRASGSMAYGRFTNSDENIQNDSSNGSGTNVTFIQNNNSPKALSRIDIYRQTRNQLAQFREAIDSV